MLEELNWIYKLETSRYEVQDVITAFSKCIFLLPICIKTLCFSWHNCMFSPHWGSKPRCKDYTCSRTKVTVAVGLWYILFCHKWKMYSLFPNTMGRNESFMDWGSQMLLWTTVLGPQTWHRIPVFYSDSVANPEPPALRPAPTISPSSLSPTPHSSLSPFFLHAQQPQSSQCPRPLLGTGNIFHFLPQTLPLFPLFKFFPPLLLSPLSFKWASGPTLSKLIIFSQTNLS